MSDGTALVSVTIPFRNREDFLPDAIESVIAQTYPRWELFLVDDGATDRSTEIARSYEARLPEQIHFLEHPGHINCGVTRTRNFGAAASQGEYLAFLDSDDAWLPHKLEHQIAAMEASPEAGLCYGPSEYWHSWNADSKEPLKDVIQPVAPAGKLYFPPFLLANSHPFGSYAAPCPSSFLIRRNAFDLVGGFVEAFHPGTYQLYEDTAFLTKMYLKVPVYVTDVCSDRYRCHSQSIWYRTQGTTREELERRFYFVWLRQYLQSQQITDPALWKLVRQKARMYWYHLPPKATGLLRRVSNKLSH
jgi:glycosyltransferase involved in cell wall biosynthesis